MYRNLISLMTPKGSSFDADAQSFFTASGITDATQKNAVNQLVLDLKSNSLWTKIKALYPVVGGNATSHSYNLKNTAQYQLSFSSGWTHSSTGMLPNGTSAYADTFLNENTTLTLNNEHISYYSRTNSTGNFGDMGTLDIATSGFPGLNLNLKWSDGNFYPRVHDNNAGIVNSGTSQGLFVSNRTNSTQVRAFQNGVLKLITSNSIVKTDVTIYIGATHRQDNTTVFYSNRECAFSSIGDGLSDSDAANFNTIVTSFQTTLGRNV